MLRKSKTLHFILYLSPNVLSAHLTIPFGVQVKEMGEALLLCDYSATFGET